MFVTSVVFWASREAALAADCITAPKALRRGCASSRLDHGLLEHPVLVTACQAQFKESEKVPSETHLPHYSPLVLLRITIDNIPL